MTEQKITNCIFTGLPVQQYQDTGDALQYLINLNGKVKLIILPWEALNWNIENVFFKENKTLLGQLLKNNNWFNEKGIIEIKDLERLIKEKDYPRTHRQKLESLFLGLSKLIKYGGDQIELNNQIIDNLIDKIYLNSRNEFDFYYNTLLDFGHIAEVSKRCFTITFKGLGFKIELEDNGELSNKCFVAMSFKNEAKEIREAIKKAIKETGFDPIIIDEKIIDSDKTINDEIISNIKKCKFCIADFSYHSNGVYFEAGYALGQKKKVIYTCKDDEFKNAHFDIKPLQHIVYNTPDQLTKELINKIEVWIK